MTRKVKRPARTPASHVKGRLSAAAKSLEATSRPQFPIVGIGASAGGLEACTALLKALPVNPGMAFVVVQHLDPRHESILHKLLSRTTEMPVVQAEDGMVLEPDHVYVIPPDKDIALRERTLRLMSRRRTGGIHLPINRFFVSLAADQKAAAIGVILSGTATDGTVGLQAIKSEGGVAFAQDPGSAAHPGMPESAIQAGCVDFALPPEEIARELIRLERLPYAKRTAAAPAGGKLGAFWGGIWGWLFGAAFFAIPGIGPVLVAGPLVAWIVGALEGAIVVGGLTALGAGLYSMGIPKDSVLKYEMALKSDKFLLLAHGTADEVARAKDIIVTTHPAEFGVHAGETPQPVGAA